MAEPPFLKFPSFFIKILDLDSMHNYILERIEVVRERIDKRKEDENKKRMEK